MRKLILILVLSVGCASATVGPDNGVSNASYRKSVDRAEQSISTIVSRLISAQKADRSDAWWQAQIDNLSAVRDQLHSTLLGATK